METVKQQMPRSGLRAVLVPAVLFLIFVVIRWTLPGHVFWSSDEGNKFIQTQALVFTNLETLALPYPSASIDPQFKYFPDGGNHFLRIRGHIYSFYPFFFPVLTVPFFKALGIAGLYVLPIGCFLILLMLIEKLTVTMSLSSYTGASSLLLAFATPFFFYALTFWEHTAAVALSTLALVYILTRAESEANGVAFFIAGILLGASTILREEGYIFFLALLPACLFVFKLRRATVFLIAGFALALLPAWLLQKQIFGHYLGTHAVGYRSPVLELLGPGDKLKQLTALLSNFYVYLFEFHPDRLKRILYALPHVAALLIALFSWRSTFRRRAEVIVLASVCCGNAILAWDLFTNPRPMFNTLYTQGFFPATPFVILAFLAGREFLSSGSAKSQFLFVLVLLYIAGTCLNLNQKYFGIIWGARHFLPIYPALIVLAYGWIEAWKSREPSADRTAAVIACVLLFALSVAIQSFGVSLLGRKLNASRELTRMLEKHPQDVIVTDAFWLPEETASLFFKKRVMMVRSESELTSLLDLLRSHGIQEFLFVRSRAYHMIPDPGIKSVIGLKKETEYFLPPGLDLLDTAILTCRLNAGAAAKNP